MLGHDYEQAFTCGVCVATCMRFRLHSSLVVPQSVLSSCSCPAYLYDSRPVRFYCQMKQMPALSNRLETIQCSSSVRRPTRAREEVR